MTFLGGATIVAGGLIVAAGSVLDAIRWLLAHVHILFPLIPAFVAIWLLLPKGTRRPLFAPAIGGVFTLGLCWFLWARSTESGLYDVLFTLFAGVAVFSAVAMILQTNPVYAALLFALVVLASTGLFFLLAAPFLAAATIIVYAGAIVVMFLFVIMMAQQSGLAWYDRHSHWPLLASFTGFALLGAILYAFERTYSTPSQQSELKEQLAELDRVDQELAATTDYLGAMARRRSSDKDAPAARLHEAIRNLPESPERQVTAERLEESLRQLDRSLVQARLEERVAEVRGIVRQLAQQTAQTERQGFLGQPRPPLPPPAGGSVAALGRSLFVRYLWAVELAGTLLTVAIIGAIAIAPRRGEAA